MDKQESIFSGGEGNQWFRRNRGRLLDPKRQKADPVLRQIQAYHLRPKRVLEIGCSVGWRLNEIRRRFAPARCVGIDPSADALREGRKRYPRITFRRGVLDRLPIRAGEVFDVVIVFYVLHWVSRDALIRSLAEIDRVVADGGHVIIGDFLPDRPVRVPYHHLPGKEVYTYKLDYAGVLLSTGRYRQRAKLLWDLRTETYSKKVPPDVRGACWLLQKSNEAYYQRRVMKPSRPKS